jgi:hypothetical protein
LIGHPTNAVGNVTNAIGNTTNVVGNLTNAVDLPICGATRVTNKKHKSLNHRSIPVVWLARDRVTQTISDQQTRKPVN